MRCVKREEERERDGGDRRDRKRYTYIYVYHLYAYGSRSGFQRCQHSDPLEAIEVVVYPAHQAATDPNLVTSPIRQWPLRTKRTGKMCRAQIFSTSHGRDCITSLKQWAGVAEGRTEGNFIDTLSSSTKYHTPHSSLRNQNNRQAGGSSQLQQPLQTRGSNITFFNT